MHSFILAQLAVHSFILATWAIHSLIVDGILSRSKALFLSTIPKGRCNREWVHLDGIDGNDNDNDNESLSLSLSLSTTLCIPADP
jgi:hypothetical protein